MDKTQRMSAAEFCRKYGAGTPSRHEQGNAKGRIFENLIMKGCQYYALKDKAIINKVYEPYICTNPRPDGIFTGRFIGKAEPDFKGVLKGGRAIAFEAKATNKSRIQRSVLTAEQMQWLDEQMIMGARTFVCVNMVDKQKRDRFFMIPWHVWADMKTDYGKKFLMPEDIPEYEVKFDGSVRFLEYVNGKVIGANA